MVEENFRILRQNFRISMRLHHVILPFTTVDLLSILANANLGYTLAVPQKDLLLDAGPQGEIAKKGNTVVDINSTMQVMGVSGTDPDQVINVFTEIYDIIETMLKPNIKLKVMFFEVLSNHSMIVKENTLTTFGNYKYGNNIEQEISDILGEKLENYSIHLCSNEKLIDSADWFDIQILPSGRRPDRELEIGVVCRKPNKEKITRIVKNMNTNLDKIIKTL